MQATNHIFLSLFGTLDTRADFGAGRFLKEITHQWVDERGGRLLAPYCVRRAVSETMGANRRAALIRRQEMGHVGITDCPRASDRN